MIHPRPSCPSDIHASDASTATIGTEGHFSFVLSEIAYETSGDNSKGQKAGEAPSTIAKATAREAQYQGRRSATGRPRVHLSRGPPDRTIPTPISIP